MKCATRTLGPVHIRKSLLRSLLAFLQHESDDSLKGRAAVQTAERSGPNLENDVREAPADAAEVLETLRPEDLAGIPLLRGTLHGIKC